jgi:SAM-dependent methyltransferase
MVGKKRLLVESLACAECRGALTIRADQLECTAGHQFPVVRGIPRFVSSDDYVSSFSFEWLKHKTTQLDRFRNDRSSEGFFRQKTGFEPKDLKGKLVLDAGVGAGRFADVMARWGANVIGIDLSYAVESSHDNFQEADNVLIAQADIGRAPFREETFDFIVSIGVLHHTPDTRKYLAALVPLLKKGGTICIWVYPTERSFVTRKQWIPFTSRIPQQLFYRWCEWFVPLALKHEDSAWVRIISNLFPFSNQKLGIENDVLDTFDGYSPRYHGVHSPDEVEGWFKESGLVAIRRLAAATAVRGVRPQT